MFSIIRFAFALVLVIVIIANLSMLCGSGIETIDEYQLKTSNACHVPLWNRVQTDSPVSSFFKKFSRWIWKKMDLSYENNQNYTTNFIFGAYVYKDHISVSLTAQYLTKQKVYCRYLDCRRVEIPGSAWQGIVFPQSVVHCPRRAGAEYVTITQNFTENLAEDGPDPVALTFRAYEEPPHELTVCVAPIYGAEPKWLQIVEFLEHYKLQGATYFYLYIGDITPYDMRIVNDYLRTGDVEVIWMQDKYERPFYAWHAIQVQDCHLRSKYHSRWTAVIDLDERIQMGNNTHNMKLVDYLRDIYVNEPNVGVVQMLIQNIVKNEDVREKYENVSELRKEIFFKKFTNYVGITFDATKAIVRPELIGMPHIHTAVALELGVKVKYPNATDVVVRHYRSTMHRQEGNNWDKNRKFQKVITDPLFATALEESIVRRVQNVYDRVPVNCSLIASAWWQVRRFPDPCVEMSQVFKK